MNNLLFLTLIFAYILDIIRPQSNFGITGVTLQNMVIYLSMTVLSMSGVASGKLKQQIPKLSISIYLFVLVCFSFFFLQFMSDLSVPFIDNARKAKTLVFDPIILYLLSFLLVSSVKKGRQYLTTLVVVLGLLNIITLLAARFNIDMFNIGEHYKEKNRFVGLAGNPNKTAYLLCVMIPFQYYLYKLNRGFVIKALMIGLILFEIITILFTGSRGGLFGLVIVFIGLAYIFKDYKQLVVLPSILFPMVLVALVFSGNEYIVQFFDRLSLLASDDMSEVSSSRFDIWGALIDVWTSSIVNIMTGIGFGAAEYVGYQYRAHNMYLQVLVELGVVGFLSFLVIIFKIYKRSTSTFTREHLALRRIITLNLFVLCFAWLFTSLIGILELIIMLISIGAAYFYRAVNQERVLYQRNGEM